MFKSIKFAVGGAVQAQAGTYLRRPADEELFQACQAGQFAYVLTGRQSGKSSLMFETNRRLREAGVRTALIDLSSIGQQYIQADNWYFSLIDELARELKLKVNVQTWWEDRPPLSTTIQRFLQFLRDVVLQEISAESIVIFVDEIDTTVDLDFTDDFFIAIRSIYNDRGRYLDYHRLSFVLSGMASPSELIRDDSRTPFNIGGAVTLRDFTMEECAPFRQAIEARYSGGHYFEQIYDWTGGHPYLTQKLSRAVMEWPGESGPDLVETLVTKLFFTLEGPVDDNLQFVQRVVTHNRQVRKLLSLYKQVLQAPESIPDDEKSVTINRLKLYGLVTVHNGKLKVRNKLYARAFNLTWVEEILEKSTKGLGLPPNYQIVQELGQGGFSTVYLAQMTRETGEIENVAVKVLNLRDTPDDEVDRMIKRFEREALTVARLKHPHIIQIYDTGRSDTGRANEQTLFIAMEHIPGGTLGEKLRKEGSLRRDEAVAILKQVGAALTYAHTQGVIHRDVKPENILLDTRSEPVRLVLSDFGLVKEVSVIEAEPLTTRLLGTARYMAPEQLAPERWNMTKPTPATDVYALAITFFEMLTGKHPFVATSNHQLTDPEFMSKHLNEPLPRLGEIAPKIGSFFDDILSRATVKNPAERIANVTDFIEAIEAANNEANRIRAARLIAVARDDLLLDDNPDKALARIAEALEAYPGDVEALRLKGKVESEQGRYEAALQSYQQAYEQTADPSSGAGQDYLRTLTHIAETSWQAGEYQRSMELYQVIRKIRAEHEGRGGSAPLWADTLTELAQYYRAEADNAYAEGRPGNLVDAIDILKRKVHVLECLGADPESQDLQEKLRHLQIKFHYNRGNEVYAAGNPESLSQAMKVLRTEIQELDQLGAEAENQDLQEKLRHLQILHHQSIGQRAYAGGDPEDLIKALEILQREIKVLEDLEAEPERQDLVEKLRQLQIKLHYERWDETYAVESSEDLANAIEILQHKIQALESLGAEQEKNDLAEKLLSFQIKFHYDRGDKAYAAGSPENFGKAIEILQSEIQTLERLRAESESQDLQRKLITLQVKQYQTIIKDYGVAIARLKTQAMLDNGEVFKYYEEVDKAYQALSELESDQIQWTIDRHNTLKESAELRKELAREAEKKHQYEIALRHYQAILRLEQAKKYEGLGQELELDLDAKTAELAVKADYDRKYQEIEKLVETAPLQALEQLIDDFIEKGVYDHREVAKLLWKLIYARQHNGSFPPELVASETVHNQLAETEQELAQVRQEVMTARNDLAEAHRKLQEREQQASPDEQMLQKLKRQHGINKAVIPLSLLVAVGAGGIIAPELRELPGLPVIMVILLVLLIIYAGYYVWTYYISPLPEK